MSEFASPGSAGSLDYQETLGHLLVITPTEWVEEVQTTLGPKSAIRADVVDLDNQEAMEDVLIFPRVLSMSLRNRVGQKVLGRLAQGVAKPGQNAPWVIEDASTDAEAVKAAQAWFKAQPKPASGFAPSVAPF